MSKCIKTGITIEAGGRVYHTDAHLEGNCLIFSACTEQNADAAERVWRKESADIELVVEGNYYHGLDGTIVCKANHCTVLSQALIDQWAKYDAAVLSLVSIDTTKE